MDGRRWKGRGWEKKGGKEVEGTPYVSLNFYHNSLWTVDRYVLAGKRSCDLELWTCHLENSVSSSSSECSKYIWASFCSTAFSGSSARAIKFTRFPLPLLYRPHLRFWHHDLHHRFSNGHSRIGYLCQVSLKFLRWVKRHHYVSRSSIRQSVHCPSVTLSEETMSSRHAQYGRTTHGLPDGRLENIMLSVYHRRRRYKSHSYKGKKR